MKQSYIYLFLQALNISVGLFVTFYIAHSVDPKLFSIYAVSNIVVAIMSTFTFLGYETVLLRNLLQWKENNQNNKIKNFVSYALVSRLIFASLVFFPMLGYMLYLSEYKYNGEYFTLFITFAISGIFSALLNSTSLILKSFNKYIISFSVTSIIGGGGRLLAILAFNEKGFNGFIYIIVLIPVISFLISFCFLKKHFSIRQVQIRRLAKFRKYKLFILSGYSNYFKLSVDQFLVSIFMSSEILAVYNLARKVEEIGRSTVNGFFEPLTQSLIRKKGKSEELKSSMLNVFRVRNILGLLSIFFAIIFIFKMDYLIDMVELGHYNYLSAYLTMSIITCVLFMLYKVESHLVYLFDPALVLIKIDVFVCSLSTMIVLLSFYFFSENYFYLNRVLYGFALLLMYLIYFKFFSNSNYVKS